MALDRFIIVKYLIPSLTVCAYCSFRFTFLTDRSHHGRFCLEVHLCSEMHYSWKKSRQLQNPGCFLFFVPFCVNFRECII